jgi:hypothetical protein
MSNVAAIFCSQFNTGYNIVLPAPSITVFVETMEHKEYVACGRGGFQPRRAFQVARSAVKTTTFIRHFSLIP